MEMKMIGLMMLATVLGAQYPGWAQGYGSRRHAGSQAGCKDECTSLQKKFKRLGCEDLAAKIIETCPPPGPTCDRCLVADVVCDVVEGTCDTGNRCCAPASTTMCVGNGGVCIAHTDACAGIQVDGTLDCGDPLEVCCLFPQN